MAELFIYALLGHLVGDYLFQTKRMALEKSKPGWNGIRQCSLHVAVYTVAVCLFWRTRDPLVITLVAVPHWAIDRWSLADHWLGLIGGRTFEAAYNSPRRYREFDIAFTSIVYTVTDNTLHLLCLFAVIQLVLL